MRVIQVRNVNEAYEIAIRDALNFMQYHQSAADDWSIRDSRVGQVLEYNSPWVTIYERPTERVLLNITRDANPFFHLMESLWILSGRNDVEWVSQFNNKIKDYSDNGELFHGAYGHRIKEHFGMDQLHWLIIHLKDNPDSRRGVIQIWSSVDDLGTNSKDIPCNTHIYFKIRDNRLYMTVCCRSNDVIWGCYGANAVHFSVLQEYVASKLGLTVGQYIQVSDSFHIYMNNPAWERHIDGGSFKGTALYKRLTPIETVPLAMLPDRFDEELRLFMKEDWLAYRYYEPFFENVATPMRRAWDLYKKGIDKSYYEDVQRYIRQISATDWRIACDRWMRKRYDINSTDTETQE